MQTSTYSKLYSAGDDKGESSGIGKCGADGRLVCYLLKIPVKRIRQRYCGFQGANLTKMVTRCERSAAPPLRTQPRHRLKEYQPPQLNMAASRVGATLNLSDLPLTALPGRRSKKP